MSCDIKSYLADKWFLREVVWDDHSDFEVIHEGDDIIEYSDYMITLFVIQHKESGINYGVNRIRQGNPDDPNWDYDFLGEVEEREIVTTEWVTKKA